VDIQVVVDPKEEMVVDIQAMVPAEVDHKEEAGGGYSPSGGSSGGGYSGGGGSCSDGGGYSQEGPAWRWWIPQVMEVVMSEVPVEVDNKQQIPKHKVSPSSGGGGGYSTTSEAAFQSIWIPQGGQQ
jgi:hypothetical protein